MVSFNVFSIGSTCFVARHDVSECSETGDFFLHMEYFFSRFSIVSPYFRWLPGSFDWPQTSEHFSGSRRFFLCFFRLFSIFCMHEWGESFYCCVHRFAAFSLADTRYSFNGSSIVFHFFYIEYLFQWFFNCFSLFFMADRRYFFSIFSMPFQYFLLIQHLFQCVETPELFKLESVDCPMFPHGPPLGESPVWISSYPLVLRPPCPCTAHHSSWPKVLPFIPSGHRAIEGRGHSV